MMATARSLPPQVRDKLGKLIVLLSSTNAGERVAATEAIGRLLKSHDRDWHDLAGMLHLSETPAPPRPSSSPPPSSSSWRRTTGPMDLPRAQLLDLVDLIEERSPFLPVRSSEFVTAMRARARIWPVVRLSEKQWKWLQDMIERTGV
jgi:hypothetical protein